MCSIALLVFIVFANSSFTSCVQHFRSQKLTKNHTHLQRLSKLHHLDIGEFCEVGCVLNDPKSRPRIEDPGRNLHNTFSVISTSYVVEVLGSHVGLSGHPFRVMLSEQTLSKNLKTVFELQRLTLNNGELIQRITFNLKTEFVITTHTKRRKVFTVRIPRVVPHVILMYDYTLTLEEGEASGVVSVGVSDYPLTVEVEVMRDGSGRCRMKYVDREIFKNYLISVKVRGNDRHVIGAVTKIIQDLFIEDGYPFETYLNEINEFALRFLKEAILQGNSMIKKNKELNDFCDTISHTPFRPSPNPDPSRNEDSYEDDTSISDDNFSSKKDSSVITVDSSSSSEDSSSSRNDKSYRGNSCQDTCRPKCVRCKCKKNPLVVIIKT